MALTLGDNFSYMGSKPLDARLKYSTVAEMKAMADSTLYDGCLAYCAATDKNYQWKSTNTVDPDLGKWREFTSGGGGASDLADLGDVNLSSPSNDDVLKYDSTSGKWVNGQGGGSSYTAGDGIDITNDEISTDNMPSADMSEVISPLPGVMSRRMKYSTEEQVIGEWIDGKPLYQKTFNITVSAVAQKSTFSYNLLPPNSGYFFVSGEGVFINSNGNTKYSVPTSVLVETSGLVSLAVYIHENSSSGLVFFLRNYNATVNSNSKAYITIRYTKTTD